MITRMEKRCGISCSMVVRSYKPQLIFQVAGKCCYEDEPMELEMAQSHEASRQLTSLR